MTMSPLNVTITREGQVCVLAVSGELDIATTPALTQQAAAALRQPAERLIIDLSGLQFIDCGGARALAAVIRGAPPGCPVLVRGAGRRVRRILDLLAVPLERPGTVTLERVRWLLVESQVLVSWAQEACANSRVLAAQSRQARDRRTAIRGSTWLTAGVPAPGTGREVSGRRPGGS